MPAYRYVLDNSQGLVPADEVAAFAAAVPAWVAQLAQLWPEVAGTVCRVGTAVPGEIPVHLVAQITDEQALAYHNYNTWEGVSCVVELPMCQRYRVPWTQSASHEIGESLINPFLNRMVTVPVGSSAPQSLMCEICDPVTSDIILVDGIAFSNATGPLFWAPGSHATSRFDLCGNVHAPLPMIPQGGAIELPGGQLQYGELVSPLRRAFIENKHGRRWMAKQETRQ